MLQRLLTDTVWAKGFLVVCGMGILIRLITVFSYRGMRKASENMTKTKKKWVTALKKRYENYERFDKLGNVEVFVDKFFERKGILGIPLSIWDRAVQQLAIVSFLMGTAGAFYSYTMNFGSVRTISTLFVGFMGGGILLFFHNLGSTEELKQQIIINLKDYLENGPAHRMAVEQMRDKKEEKKRDTLPTREEVEGLSEAAVTEEERQVLLDVLEEYFW
jgi:hypothetical protein